MKRYKCNKCRAILCQENIWEDNHHVATYNCPVCGGKMTDMNPPPEQVGKKLAEETLKKIGTI